MLVADSNLLAYLFIAGDKTAEVEALLKHDPEWIAPRLWRSELLNVLALYHRVKAMPLAACLEAFEMAEELVGKRTYDSVSWKVLELAAQTGCSGYDSEFLSLAQEVGVRLVTYDQKLIDRSGEIACTPAEFLSR